MTTRPGPFREKTPNPEQLASRAQKSPDLLRDVFDGLDSDEAATKFGCAKALRILSHQKPELLYPQFEFFAALMDHRNKIFQWEGIHVLSHLACVDTEDKFGKFFAKYFSPIPGPVMITAANVIRGGPAIARAKPHLADKIAAEILKVGRARYATAECRNVAIGHALIAFGEFYDLLSKPAPVLSFVRRQLKNSRPATRKKAESFLKRFQPS